MSNYVIIHGRLHETSDDELIHWKYVKRVKKNGRWVYYYDQSELDAMREKIAETERKTFLDTRGASPTSGHIVGINTRSYNELKALTKEYNTKKVSTFASRTISKGAVKVGNLFSKVFSKKR